MFSGSQTYVVKGTLCDDTLFIRHIRKYLKVCQGLMLDELGTQYYIVTKIQPQFLTLIVYFSK